MITVRFSTGFSIQYNYGTNIKRFGTDMYVVDSKGCWIAKVPEDCVAEAAQPCRTYFAGTPDLKTAVDNAAKSVRSLTRKLGKVGK